MIVGPRAAWRMARLLVSQVREARERGERLDDELLATVAAIETSANFYAARRAGCATSCATTTDPLAVSATPGTLARMTTPDVAARIGCSSSHVTSLARRRVLPAEQLGRAWTFSPTDVEAFLAGRSQP